jgi:hypothetical protein
VRSGWNQSAVNVSDDKIREIVIGTEEITGMMPDGGLKPDRTPPRNDGNDVASVAELGRTKPA